jgi:hypothetical protein
VLQPTVTEIDDALWLVLETGARRCRSCMSPLGISPLGKV